MTARREVIDALWFGTDPIESFPVNSHPPDHQGWNSDHGYLVASVNDVRPKIIIEVGVWKGGSVKTLARAAKEARLDCVVIAIDTWLGSTEHWMDQGLHRQLRVRDGYPELYHTFVSNVIDAGLQDFVVPLPMDSINALHLIKSRNIIPDIIHIDAGHDYQSATSDLENWWPLLKSSGLLIGDDYYTDGIHWQDVRRAFDDFFKRNQCSSFESRDGKCLVRK